MNIASNFNESSCCGCFACADICPKGAIDVGKDKFSFSIPIINEEKCISCSLCVKVCPYLSSLKLNVPKKAVAAHNMDQTVLVNSSSGGIFYQIALKFLESGGIVYGASFRENKVCHIRVDSIEQLCSLQKSKYIQSDTYGVFREIQKDLSNGDKVLFSGTPCQVTAVKSFVSVKGNLSNLFLLDIVCHGVPSQDFFDDYLNHLQSQMGTITSYTFRAKREPLNGMNCYLSYKVNNRTIYRNWPEDSFNWFYMMGKIYRDSCNECKFARKERASDITLCDYWGWDKYLLGEFDPDASVSGCVINSEKGNLIFDAATEGLKIKQTKYGDIAEHNGCLISGHKDALGRYELLRDWKEKGYSYVDKKFRRTHKKQIIKYHMLRMLPKSSTVFLSYLRGKKQ